MSRMQSCWMERGFEVENDFVALYGLHRGLRCTATGWTLTSLVEGLRVRGPHTKSFPMCPSDDEPVHDWRDALAELALDCIIAINHRGEIVEFNPAAEATFGHLRANVLGRNLADLIIPEEHRGAHSAGMRHFLATGEGPVIGRRIELEAIRATGERFPVELAISAVGRHDAKPLFTAYLRDISERTRAISERKKSDNALRAALERAEEASQAKDAFLANLSHEIRTPLAAMLGYSDLIASSIRNDPELSEWMRVVRSNGGYLHRILGDLLDLSMIEAGQITLEPRPFRLDQLLALEEATFAQSAAEKGLSLAVTIAGQIPRVITSDAARLRQVLSNLLSNAIKYTSAGRIRLRVEASRVCEGRSAQVTFEVEDTGIGIPLEHQQEVFDRFVRLEDAGASGAQGVGLGLAIVQRIVECMNGEVSLRSAPGLGTSVRVVLPLEGAEDWGLLESAALGLGHADREPTARALTGRVLVADDVQELARLFAAWLRRCGLDVEVVHDGDSALQLVRSESFDLLLIDWSMPGKDGLEVVRALRAEGSSVPIVALTAHASQAARDTCLSAGCDAYLVKPAGQQQLLSLVAELLNATDPRKPLVVRGGANEEDPFAGLRQRYVAALRAETGWFGPALVAQNWTELSERGHRIKGTSASFGLEAISEAARALEQACVAKSTDLAEGAIAHLVAEIEALEA